MTTKNSTEPIANKMRNIPYGRIIRNMKVSNVEQLPTINLEALYKACATFTILGYYYLPKKSKHHKKKVQMEPEHNKDFSKNLINENGIPPSVYGNVFDKSLAQVLSENPTAIMDEVPNDLQSEENIQPTKELQDIPPQQDIEENELEFTSQLTNKHYICDSVVMVIAIDDICSVANKKQFYNKNVFKMYFDNAWPIRFLQAYERATFATLMEECGGEMIELTPEFLRKCGIIPIRTTNATGEIVAISKLPIPNIQVVNIKDRDEYKNRGITHNTNSIDENKKYIWAFNYQLASVGYDNIDWTNCLGCEYDIDYIESVCGTMKSEEYTIDVQNRLNVNKVKVNTLIELNSLDEATGDKLLSNNGKDKYLNDFT